MYSHSTDHIAHMTCVQGSRSLQGSSLSCVAKKKSSTRHVSSCASKHTEHQHKFSLIYLSCVAFVYLSDPRPVVHASIYPLYRSTAGWHFHRIPTSHNCGAHDVVQKIESGKGLEGRTRGRRPSAQSLLPVVRGFGSPGLNHSRKLKEVAESLLLLDEAARRMDEKAACAEEKVNAVWQRNETSEGRVAEGNTASLAAVRNCKNLTVALRFRRGRGCR